MARAVPDPRQRAAALTNLAVEVAIGPGDVAEAERIVNSVTYEDHVIRHGRDFAVRVLAEQLVTVNAREAERIASTIRADTERDEAFGNMARTLATTKKRTAKQLIERIGNAPVKERLLHDLTNGRL
ncbi:hypothetical protein [Streptomyces sp. BE230]|uniref:hypothetical protein n=1 Tax=Streptomyces sp. BE230 TaxID=3002526 RepID=UPI002ED67DD1|nr:hypothetical protein [Streptomyces sp. BE230]